MKRQDITLPDAERRTTAYVSDRIQLAGVLERILSAAGRSDILISTFSASEEFLRGFHRLRKAGLVGGSTMFCDIRALAKTASLKIFMSEVFGSVRLCRNHSKMILADGPGGSFAVVTSQNLTRGDRFEAGIISSDPFIINLVRDGFTALAENSIALDVHQADH